MLNTVCDFKQVSGTGQPVLLDQLATVWIPLTKRASTTMTDHVISNMENRQYT